MQTPTAPGLLPLPDSEVHLWLVFLDRITNPETLHAYEKLLTPDDEARYRRFAFARNREQFLIARALLRTTLSRYAPVPAADWRFRASSHGKPEVALPAGFAQLQFNLSHTDGLVACVVASGRAVGVDVEHMGRREVRVALARYCLSTSELAHWEGLASEDRQTVFFDYWTLKEAYIKARGLGLSVPLRDVSFHLQGHGPPVISFAAGFDDDPQAWQFAQLRPGESHRAAVAVRRTDGRDLALVIRETVPFADTHSMPSK
jgi:4'-phosphopantetheinyl transferase